MDVKVRVRGVTEHVRDLARISDDTKKAAIKGTLEAANHLLQKVIDKIGNYQQSGGSPNVGSVGRGKWPRLSFETRQKKMRKYGVGDKPLYMTGKLKRSFRVVPGGKDRISASVGSDSPYLIHHVYGAYRAHVPQRDPIRVTAVEESETCTEIIEKQIKNTLTMKGGFK